MKNLMAFLLLFCGVLGAQNDSLRNGYHKDCVRDSSCENQPFVKIISVSVGGGGQLIRTGFQDISLIQQAAPSSTLAFADLSQFGTGTMMFPVFFGNANTASVRGIAVNLRFGCQKKFSETRFGIYQSTMGISSQNYSRYTSTPIDTVIVPGGSIVTDSLFTSSYSYNWYSEAITIEASWIARTNPARILSFYSGFGMHFGIGFNGKIENSFNENSYLLHRGTGEVTSNYVTGYTNRTDITEQLRAPGFFYTAVQVPIGMNIRLGRRNAILKHLVLHYEYQAQLQIIAPSGLDTQVRTASGFSVGLKWMIDVPHIHRPGKNKHAHNYHE